MLFASSPVNAKGDELTGAGLADCGYGSCVNHPFDRWRIAVLLVVIVDETAPPESTLNSFVDVGVDEWWAPYVERLFELGITRGCAVSPARYCPEDRVTRAQLASFLVRAFELEEAASGPFTDISTSGHADDINASVAPGVMAGCRASLPDRFCPHTSPTRGQLIEHLSRAEKLEANPALTAIAAGERHSCALNSIGSIKCWGSNEFGESDPPIGLFTAITAGDSHSCALGTDGSISCWGNNDAGQSDPPRGQFAAVAAAKDHSCAVKYDGMVLCWGNSPAGIS